MSSLGLVVVSIVSCESGLLQEGDQYSCILQDTPSGFELVPQNICTTSFIIPSDYKLQLIELSKRQFIVKCKQPDGTVCRIQFSDENQSSLFQQRCLSSSRSMNIFDERTDKSSSDMYFHYYGLLMHQQNMMQDLQRTGMYYWAVASNTPDFAGKLVMDVGAGSGILSSFAAQAGAKTVYAVEASEMAQYCARLLKKQTYGNAIQVVQKKLEEIQVADEELGLECGEHCVPKVDVLISEPMGTLLVNERMLETYITARKRFLKQGGYMYPNIGQLFAALFSDEMLHQEIVNKAVFWCNRNFFGVDLTPLYEDSLETYFRQVVIDSFNPGILVSSYVCKQFDFLTLDEEDLHKIEFPFEYQIFHNCVVHGIASWFEVSFQGSQSTKILSTAPGLAPTHWHQMRFVLRQPIIIKEPSRLAGCITMIAHDRQSYDITLTINRYSLFQCQVTGGQPAPLESRTASYDLKDPYYRQFQANWFGQTPQESATADRSVPENNFDNTSRQFQHILNQGQLQQQNNGDLQELMIMEEYGVSNQDNQIGNGTGQSQQYSGQYLQPNP
eukprot:TRINITY_DN12017_c0_g2_i2.p1 TRINITY_DN12017_c0_g2~~TRINITY_DN12017_c0_g2_i2.p1  ORF type:complete len:557 (-),score=33.73 TRINITY_DN12017_c0_g2_i2:190-1860(-)